MRIAVTDLGRGFGRQTRAYAEYRIFTKLARFSALVREADVSLTPAAAGGTVRCTVAVTVEGGHHLRASARGPHVYGAINRAAQRIDRAVRQHLRVEAPA